MVSEMEEGMIRLATALDKQDMIGFTLSFIDDYKSGRESVNRELLPWLAEIDKGWAGILFIGMGGSAAAGDFVATLCDIEGAVPVKCHRGYDIPNWWTPDWLVVATSYSGNTEETLSACEQAIDQDATVVVISSGGILSGMCELSDSVYLISCPGGQPPRSAFGHIFSRHLSLMIEIGILRTELSDAAIKRLQEAIEDSNIIIHPEGDVASLALNMTKNPIAILGPQELMPAINRFKNQLNENSARFARVGLFPEMNHNELVGWASGNEMDVVLLIRTSDDFERTSIRMDLCAEIFRDIGADVIFIDAAGEGQIQQLMDLVFLGDYLSLLLAEHAGVDPVEIKNINLLKNKLSDL